MKIDLNEMRSACAMKIKHFKKIIPYNNKGKYWFQDNGANILAVAHLDSVQEFKHFHEMKLSHKHRIYCPVLDDRLGVYIILYLLPKLNLKYDILLTTDEEIGRSTASNFTTEKQYNWIFEFDRKGGDVVMYDYETPEIKENLEKVGWKVGKGSYTDISELQFLECKAFNFGTGYEDYHSLDAYVDLKVMAECVQKFFLFYNKFKDVHLPHKEVEKVYSFNRHSWKNTSGYYYGEDWEDDYKCPKCHGAGWIGGVKCTTCDGDGWVWETKKKIVTLPSTTKCIACGDTGKNSKGGECLICKKKSTTIPTLSDFYSYSCVSCGSYTEIDLDTCGDEAIEAAELTMCVPCHRKTVFFT